MPVTINGVAHDENLVWADEFVTARRLGSRRQTCGVGGRTVIQGLQTDIKKIVTITASYDGGIWLGHWTRAQILALETLEKSGAVFTIVYEAREVQAMVAPGGLADLAARSPRPNAEDSDWYYGSVVFWEV